MSAFLTHGRIMGGVVATPDLDASLNDYHRTLGLSVIEQGEVSDILAFSWGCAGIAYSAPRPLTVTGAA